MTRTDEVWKTAQLAQTFLEGVRGAIPLANQQLEMILRIIQMAQSEVNTVLDLGCGDGILGRTILTQYPDAKVVFLDFSEAMISAVQDKLANHQNQVEFILGDFGQSSWVNLVQDVGEFDVIVSGFAIHHQPDYRKQEIYQEIYNLLTPVGVFLNLEHIQSASNFGESVFNEMFIDSLLDYHHQRGNHQSREEIAQHYYNRPDKEANILAPVELQCQWLREMGFLNVDCFMKVLELALFGGIKP
ncbi:class I SAM-dependent methyltransferase [Limnoraphis robusta Tam1]|uniref:class I SAM-dependent methyltransferase n=1 Tax=Limnoraphis robusta TaxID=1118279 RepID=UPI002B1E9667|nr:class I SAM-dependent methyltransferase [Limnoraphis robusta]MEA5543271.1 class I SAM-dependent methyltransferase [Limnoraphis robusta Tam1]